MTTPVPRRVRRQIADIARMASALEAVIGIPYAMYADKVRLGYPTGGSGRSSSDVSDPTVGAALDPVNGFRDRQRQDELGMIELLERRVTLIHIGLAGLTDDIARQRRLSPELALAAWVVERCESPACVENAVRAGLCWRHYREHLEAKKQEAS